MGRTLESIRRHLHSLMADWEGYAHALTRQEQADLAWLWQAAQRHASAIGEANRPVPMEAVLLSMSLELLKEVRRLEARIHRLEEQRADGGG